MQGVTRNGTGLQGVKGGYERLQVVIRDHRGL